MAACGRRRGPRFRSGRPIVACLALASVAGAARWIGTTFGVVAVSGESMHPTLQPGDACLVRYGARVREGHVVVARLPQRPLGIKRAMLHDADGWYLVSDNPSRGTDSATFGSVPDADVLGRVLLRYWPRPAWFAPADPPDPAGPARRRRS
jgi:nickel-type superoxide dismutase maturation protease